MATRTATVTPTPTPTEFTDEPLLCGEEEGETAVGPAGGEYDEMGVVTVT
jgi:hypothetical protein